MKCRVCWLLLLMACPETGFVVKEEDLQVYVTLTEGFVQRPRPALDLLFVVDNTRSMRVAQESVSAGFEQLALSLSELGVRWQAI